MSRNLDREIRFLNSIAKAIENDSAARGVLKRSLVNDASHQLERYRIVLPRLPKDIHPRDQDLWIFVACLLAYYHQKICPDKRQSFGASCRQLEMATTTKGAERRFSLLLAQPRESVVRPLTTLFWWMSDKRIKVDYPTLLADLCQWGHPDGWVQDRWAQDFCRR